MHKWTLLVIGFVAILSVPRESEARLVKFVVDERVSIADGVQWGATGPYERLKGKAYFELDPLDPHNAVIVNLDRAPKNAGGRVEFSTRFLILKPVDMRRGNHKIWYGINNRGNCLELGIRAFPAATSNCNPLELANLGANNVLLNQGYAVVDAGWHGDLQPNPDLLYPDFPMASQPDGSPIVGLLRLENQPMEDSFTLPLLSSQFRPYETADTNTANSTLTVRERQDAPGVPVPADQWAFGTCPDGQKSLTATTTDLCLFDKFEAGKIYELIYPAKNPIVMGLGYAVTRDIGSFLRYHTHDDSGNANPLAHGAEGTGSIETGTGPVATGIRRAYSSGSSSTGMYQRDWLYLGFNEDEAERQVFEAVTIYSAGAHRLFANVQFAHPTFYSGQDTNHDYLSNSVAPMTFAITTDPISGLRDGILKRPATDPKVFQIDEELVFWQWQAALNTVDGAGHQIPIPKNVRLYHQNGFGHISAAGLLSAPIPAGACEHSTQGLGGISLTPRALAVAIDEWADRGIEPPQSRYPGLRRQDLVTLDEYRDAFPAIPGVAPPGVLSELRVLNYGPLLGPAGGIQTVQSPLSGSPYQILVPAPDKDGVGVAGIDTILTRAPLGTNLGWNTRPGARAPDLCSLGGSFLPFAKTKAERLASGDGRRSLEERYKNHRGFVTAVEKATRELVKERFLLAEDAPAFIQAAEDSEVLR